MSENLKIAARMSVLWRVVYLAIATAVFVSVIVITGSIVGGTVAMGGCALCATCAALAVTWDHRDRDFKQEDA